jgi:hypothetical protein
VTAACRDQPGWHGNVRMSNAARPYPRPPESTYDREQSTFDGL